MSAGDPRCGTVPGYARHRRRSESPCAECAAARRDYDKRRREANDLSAVKNRLITRARNRAERRLAHIYPGVFMALHEEEREALFRDAGIEVREYQPRGVKR